MVKNKNKLTNIVHPDDRYKEVYFLIGQHLWGSNENFWVIEAISDIRKSLWKKYDLSSREIQHHVYLKFIEQKILDQYDPSLSSLKTYTAHKTWGKMLDLRKSYDRIYGKNQFKMLKVFHSQNSFIPENNFCIRYKDEAIDEKSSPELDEKLYTKDQVAVFNRLIEYRSPEDIAIDNETLVLVHEYFDEVDILVLEDIIDRKEAAERSSLSYDAYCKRLQRKINSFKILAAKAGHC